MSKNIVIAIDGPAGSGKSTLAKFIADRLGFLYLDTGAMYRAVTYQALKEKVIDDVQGIISLAKSLSLDLKYSGGKTRVFINNEEVTDFIRTPEVNSHVSPVSKIAGVRNALLDMQRKFGSERQLVVEGRDTTTVVFPEADVKVFMVAGVQERAVRRMKELAESGVNISFEEVKKNLEERDKIDSSRSTAPLKKAEGALEIDSTSASVEDEFIKIVEKLVEIDKSFRSHLN